MIGSGAVVVVGVLAAVTALDSGPTGRAPAVDGGHPGMPALIQPGAGATGEAEDGAPTSPGDPSGTASGSPTAPAGTTATGSTPAGPTPSGAPSSATPSAGTTGTGAGSGSAGSTQHPGKSGSAPGVTKKPR